MACSMHCHPSEGKEGGCRPCHWRSVRFTLLFLVSVGAIVGVYQFRTLPGITDETESDDNATAARLNTTNITNTSTRRPTAVFDINDVITHDRWVVIQPWANVEEPSVPEESNEPRDVRELLTCAVVDACVEQGWRPLVLAERVSCCSKPRCVLLHAAKRSRLPYELRHFFERNNITNMAAQRNLAFLFAIQHGARFVMDWYFEDPLPSDSRAVTEYQQRASQLLSSTTLDVSLGLVLERASDAPLFVVSPRPVRRVYNPHAHFGRPDLWASGYRPPEERHVSLGLLKSSPRTRLVPRWATDSPPRRRGASPSSSNPGSRQRYRVCELRPPSIEKFLQQSNGGADELDGAAPAVVIPGDTLAPASSQISMYSGEALWALALLPTPDHPVPAHLLRTLWAYPLLANIAASVKVSLSPLQSPPLYGRSTNMTHAEAASAGLSSAVLRWRCKSRSILTCVAQLGRDLAPLLGHQASDFLNTWASDLRHLRYLEPPVVPLRRGGLRSPCLGHHGLGGLSFQASPLESPSPMTREEVERRTRARGRYTDELALLDWIRQLDSSHNNDTVQTIVDPSRASSGEQAPETASVMTELPSLDTFMSTSYVGKPNKRDSEQSSIQRETVDGMCLGFSDLLPSRPNKDFSSMLLVVSFSAEGGYDLLPMLEIMYRPHFHNILYCGPSHSSLDIYLHKFQVAENRTLSYLPASASGFECLVGAMEMGYHVDDYLLVTADSLILPWNIANLNRSQLWLGSEKLRDEVITKTQWRNIDPGGQKLPRVMDAVGQALKFIAHILGIHEVDHDDHEDDEDMMPDEETHSIDEGKDKSTKPAPSTIHHEEVEPAIPELHLHAEGVTVVGDLNATSVYSYDTKDDHDPTIKEESIENITSTDPSSVIPETSSHSSLLSVEDSEHVILQDSSVSAASPFPEREYQETMAPLDTPTNASDIITEGEKNMDDIVLSHERTNKNNSNSSTYETNMEKCNSTDPIVISCTYAVEETTQVLIIPEFEISKEKEKVITSSTISPEKERHSSIVDEILEEEDEPNDYDNPENHSTAHADEASHVGLQDVASENPSDDGLLEYILSSTPSVNMTSEQTTVIPSDISNNETTHNNHNAEEEKKSEEIKVSGIYDIEGRPGIVILDEVSVIGKHFPVYEVDKEKTSDLSRDQYNISSLLEIDELTDSSLNPVHDTLSSAHVAEEIEKSAENGFSKRKADGEQKDGETKNISKRDTRHVEDGTPLSAYMDRRMERTFQYIEELIVTVASRLNVTTHDITHTQAIPNNRLDPREFKHLRCYDTGGMQAYHSNSDLCQSLRQFYMQINVLYRNEGAFTPPYTSYPIYHVPASQQKAFYLLANVFLQFGVPDHVAVPLLLRGLAHKPTELRRTYFGSDTPATVRPGYPLFDEKAQFLFPVSLQQDLHGDTRFRTVFCLKYLYNMLT